MVLGREGQGRYRLMKRLLMLATTAAALIAGGCSRPEPAGEEASAYIVAPPPGAQPRLHPKEYRDEAVAAPAADAAAAPAIPAADAAAAPPGESAVRVPAGVPMLAYSYAYGISAPGPQVDALRRRHEQACARAGMTVCQVVATSIADRGNGAIQGQLSLRATPAWLETFRDGLEGDAKGVGGRVDTSDVTSEDLSREIVDTEAQLRAKTTLRDRLQNLLAGRPGKLSDLLAVEHELARVQAEIDGARSELSLMRSRVAMSEVTIQYSARDMVSSTVRSPLSRSLGSFFGVMAMSLAAMIDIVAVAAPWALLLAGLLWLFRKRLPKVRWPFGRKAETPVAG